MTTSQTNTKSQTIELTTTAFNAFCDDISGMFSVEMQCTFKGVSVETVKGLSQKFKKLAAVNFIRSQGVLNGTFHIIFDQAGLFTLAGTIVMLPKQKIIEDRKRGTAKEAEEMTDAIKETGNMLVGSWDRIFREELEGHGHFLQSNTYIGNPWDNPKEKIGLPDGEELTFASYEIIIGDYPAFNCGVIFPEAIFVKPSEPQAEAATADKQSEEEPADKETAKIEASAEEKAETATPIDVKEPADKETAKIEASVEEKAETVMPIDDKEPATGPVSEIIQKMVQTSPQTSESGLQSLKICAKDIMRKEVLWGNPDDSVQQAMAKMEQAESRYMMIGKDELPEGIISTFDMASAVSVYLKPMFAKWRRPADDATLQIKIKWIMSKPVRTVKPDTSLKAIIESMYQSGLQCLPVIEKNGKVVGLVTVSDIFNALLNAQ